MNLICFTDQSGASETLCRELREALPGWDQEHCQQVDRLLQALAASRLSCETLLLAVVGRERTLLELWAARRVLGRSELVLVLNDECQGLCLTAHKLGPRVVLTGLPKTQELLPILERLAQRALARNPERMATA